MDGRRDDGVVTERYHTFCAWISGTRPSRLCKGYANRWFLITRSGEVFGACDSCLEKVPDPSRIGLHEISLEEAENWDAVLRTMES